AGSGPTRFAGPVHRLSSSVLLFILVQVRQEAALGIFVVGVNPIPATITFQVGVVLTIDGATLVMRRQIATRRIAAATCRLTPGQRPIPCDLGLPHLLVLVKG